MNLMKTTQMRESAVSRICSGYERLQHIPLVYAENHRDKHIVRMDELSDSEDEGDDRKNERSYRDAKRPRLIDGESNKNGSGRPFASGRNQFLTSPLPPEPSPITPLPQESSTDIKGVLLSAVLIPTT